MESGTRHSQTEKIFKLFYFDIKLGASSETPYVYWNSVDSSVMFDLIPEEDSNQRQHFPKVCVL